MKTQINLGSLPNFASNTKQFLLYPESTECKPPLFIGARLIIKKGQGQIH